MINVKQGKVVITSEICDRLHHGLDAVRLMVHEAVTGEPSGVNTFIVLAELMSGEESAELDNAIATEVDLFADHDDLFPEEINEDLFREETDLDIEALKAELEKEQATPVEPLASEETAKSATEPQFRRRADDIGTIRVKTEDLDKLVRQASELTIAQLRINRRMGDLNEIVNLWEELQQHFLLNKDTINKLQLETNSSNLSKLQRYQEYTAKQLEQLGDLITQLRNTTYEDNASLSAIANEMESGVKTLRLLPLANIFNPLQRLVRELSREQGKQIELVIEGADTKVDKTIIDEMKDPLLHIVRNAIDHGIETVAERKQKGKPATATILLKGYQTTGTVGIEIIDDGRGLQIDKIKQTALRRNLYSKEQLERMSHAELNSLIFAPGFSTRSEVNEISGRGVGLDVVRTNVEKLKGNIKVESFPGEGCEFRLQMSTSLGTTEALLLEVNQTTYAMPVDMVDSMKLISRQEIFEMKGTQAIKIDQQPISVVWLADLLNLAIKAPDSPKGLERHQGSISCIILRSGKDKLGVLVDAVLDQQDIVLKPQSTLLKRVRNVAGATILGNGEVCMVLNAQDLINSVSGNRSTKVKEIVEVETVPAKAIPKLLLVEDSIIIRTQMKRILEEAGYELTIAVDGAEGFKKLQSAQFDLVVSDVEMPNMSGLELTAKIRQQSEYKQLPIVLVTTLAKEEDKRRGLEAGANAYLTKGDFDQKLLIKTLKELLV
jgi:two-component system chemotaxis sensor kinase CheA